MTEFDCIKNKIDLLDSMTTGAINKSDSNDRHIEEIDKYIDKIHKLKTNENSFLKNSEQSLDLESRISKLSKDKTTKNILRDGKTVKNIFNSHRRLSKAGNITLKPDNQSF